MKILHISTHNENCGIGKYQEAYLSAFVPIDPSITNVFFQYSPNQIRIMNQAQLDVVYKELSQQVKEYDIVHIQHEFSFFKPRQLKTIVNIIKKANKPLVSTIHTKPTLEKTTRKLLSPKGIPARIKNYVRNSDHISHVKPLSRSNIVFVHNSFTKKGLIELGFSESTIKLIPIPVLDVDKSKYVAFDSEISTLNKIIKRKDTDKVIATVGYLNEVKGTLHAIKALRLLPENYKLLILGGLHPQAMNDDFLDDVSDYILKHSLSDRVSITGFVKNDDLLNALVNSADIVLFPYKRIYGSSSAALNNGFANHKPVIATPVKAFKEINEVKEYLKLSDSFSYHDIAKALMEMDEEAIKTYSALSKEYAINTSYPKLAQSIIDTYKTLAHNE